ncbi:MAG: glycosyltransferase [bacterium]|nr:glycosyltransferase [bacterium]
MLEFALTTLFWISAGLMLHACVVYPLTLRFFPRRYRAPFDFDGPLPSVAVLIPAYNEKQVIGEKLKNTLALEYPADKLEVIVGSDGSTDNTDKIVIESGDPRVRLVRFEGRNGKPRIINALADVTQADILFLTDANVVITGDFFRFINHFSDKTVAAVGAANEFAVRGRAKVATGELAYHRYVTTIKQLESQIGGFSGLEGAAYAIRKTAWQPLPLVPMNDDIVALYPAILSGGRVAFETDLVAKEDLDDTVRDEFKRRIRMGILNWGTVACCPGLLSPFRPIVAYTYFSHKVVLWFFPVLMVVALLTNALLARHNSFYFVLFVAQLTLYIASALGGLAAACGLKIPVLYQAFSFVTVMIAFLIGGVRFLLGHGSSVWERSAR